MPCAAQAPHKLISPILVSEPLAERLRQEGKGRFLGFSGHSVPVPASRYQPSLHPYPAQLEPIHYPPGMPVRKVQDKGRAHYQGRLPPVSQALRGQPVGVRATATDGLLEVLFCHQVVKRLNLAECRKAE